MTAVQERPGASTPTPTRRVPTWLLKVTMAVTGLIWAGFALVHLVGNLKVYTGPESFNTYAAWLRNLLYPLIPHEGVLWMLRVVLMVCLIAHVAGALILDRRARVARGSVRARRRGVRMWASAAMLPTGILILGFLILHVADMTLGWTGAAPAEHVPPNNGEVSAYANLVASLSRPWAAIAYSTCMVALAAHLFHGVVLAATDLGARASVRALAQWAGGLAAIAVLLGNALIPVAVALEVLS